jgi:DNA replication initiation complex subunit (GINS family)
MDDQSTVEKLRRTLEIEEASEALTALPPDTYFKLATYSQKLRAVAAPNAEDAYARLARKQLWLLESMTRRLLQVRVTKADKARKAAGDGQEYSKGLLPEERYVHDASKRLARKEERFVRAVADGQPSFFTLVQRNEVQAMTTVRISKRMGEIIGADLKRYGPFEVNDVARLPAGNAQLMVASKQAVTIAEED